jgi:hypothetical protein
VTSDSPSRYRQENVTRCGNRSSGSPTTSTSGTVAATDALIALRAGYPTCTLGGVDDTKFPLDYHWPSDTPDNLDWSSVEDALAVCEEFVRGRGAPATA